MREPVVFLATLLVLSSSVEPVSSTRRSSLGILSPASGTSEVVRSGQTITLINNAALGPGHQQRMLPKLRRVVSRRVMAHLDACYEEIDASTGEVVTTAVSTCVKPAQPSAYILSGSHARLQSQAGVPRVVRTALKSSTATLGICYGAQELDTYSGGTVRPCMGGPASREFKMDWQAEAPEPESASSSFSSKFLAALRSQLHGYGGQVQHPRAAFMHNDCATLDRSHGWRAVWVRRRDLPAGIGVEEMVALAVHESEPWVAAAFHPEASDELEGAAVLHAFLDVVLDGNGKEDE